MSRRANTHRHGARPERTARPAAGLRAGNLRRALAQEAARIMAQHGIHDFLTAKRKAAERLGVMDASALPRNIEIESALAEYQRLFAAGSHERVLSEQRRTALHAMHWLSQFEPRLVGSVLSGTATEHADIQLHLFADCPENVTLQLVDQGIAHEITERRVRLDAERIKAFPGVRFALENRRVEVTVFPRDGIRQAPVSPVDGRPMRRADAAELAALLDASLARA
jgi:predicted nucleotidyltransferase